ncbi:MAG: hypothetical protein K8W52_18920, partial [Deltaproteobacteria bacterium]|nr:hypothetical protein [Deltaproteobacteria bacterium]
NTGAAATFTWTIDTVAPVATITATPSNPSTSASATFAYTANETGATFQCRLDSAATFTTCPASYSGLADGSHTFRVRAIDLAGNTGAAATFTWVVDTTPPSISMISTPANPSAVATATFAYGSNDASAAFECKLDTAPVFSACASTASYTNLAEGSHTFQVRARDAATNVSSTLSFTWIVNTLGPTLAAVPPAGWTVNYFNFKFGAVTGATSYQCNSTPGLPAAGWAACVPGGAQVTGATYGAANPFAVRWVDALGGTSSATSTTWTPNPGLALYYPLDNSAANRSILGYPKPFYVNDAATAPAYVGGYAGGAGYFANGSAFTGSAQALTSGTAYTISVWVATASPDAATIWTNRTTGAGCTLTVGQPAAAYSAILTCYNAQGTAVGSVGTAIASNHWFNVTVSYAGSGHGDGNGGDVTVYFSGSQAKVITNTAKVDFFPLTQPDLRTSAPTSSATIIDELRIYNTTFDGQTDCEAVALGNWYAPKQTCEIPLYVHYGMDAASARNLGSNGLSAIAIAATTAGMWGKSNQSWSGQTTPTTLAVSASTDFSDRTVSLWFNDSGSAGTLFNFACPGLPGCPTGGATGMSATVAQGLLTVCAATLQSGQKCMSNIGYTPSVWHHLLITSDQIVSAQGVVATGQVITYVDGVQVGMVDFFSKGSVFASNATAIVIGSSGLGAYIDELKIWSKLLTPVDSDEESCALGWGGLFNQALFKCTPPAPPF